MAAKKAAIAASIFAAEAAASMLTALKVRAAQKPALRVAPDVRLAVLKTAASPQYLKLEEMYKMLYCPYGKLDYYSKELHMEFSTESDSESDEDEDSLPLQKKDGSYLSGTVAPDIDDGCLGLPSGIFFKHRPLDCDGTFGTRP
jgi:hypothetical protein